MKNIAESITYLISKTKHRALTHLFFRKPDLFLVLVILINILLIFVEVLSQK